MGINSLKGVAGMNSVTQPAVEMARRSDKAERPKGTNVFVPLAMAVASATEAEQEKHSSEALHFVSFLPLLWEAWRCHRIFLHLALLTLTSHCPQEEL